MTSDGADNINKRLGEILRGLREKQKMKQSQMAAFLSLTQQQIQKYESARTPLTVERLVAIANVLRADPSNIIGDITRDYGVGPITADFDESGRIVAGGGEPDAPPIEDETVDLADEIARTVEQLDRLQARLRTVHFAKTGPVSEKKRP